jgi:hypothetical protein
VNRHERREQLRDWHRLSDAEQLHVVLVAGLDAVPESERHRFTIDRPDLEPSCCPSCGRP